MNCGKLTEMQMPPVLWMNRAICIERNVPGKDTDGNDRFAGSRLYPQTAESQQHLNLSNLKHCGTGG